MSACDALDKLKPSIAKPNATKMASYDFDNLFASERLVYRARDVTEENKALMREIMTDPATLALSTNSLLHPQIASEVDDMLEKPNLSNVLDVVVCISPTDRGAAETAAISPEAVGFLSLDCHPKVRHHRSLNLG